MVALGYRTGAKFWEGIAFMDAYLVSGLVMLTGLALVFLVFMFDGKETETETEYDPDTGTHSNTRRRKKYI